MSTSNFKTGIVASIENGDRLLEDAKSMFEWERFPTSYALAVLAQEEYAKALLLSLIDAGAIPWSAAVQRVLCDHICKQLISVCRVVFKTGKSCAIKTGLVSEDWDMEQDDGLGL